MFVNVGFIRGRRVGSQPTLLIGSNYINPSLTFSRASSAAYFNDADTLVEVGSNLSRFGVNGLILEGQRTNNVVNSRAEGFTAGTPGTLPTNWTMPTVQTGLTRVLSSVSSGGFNGLGIGFSGTATTSNTSFEPSSRAAASAALPSQTRSVTAVLWLVSGSPANISSIALGGIFVNSSNVLVTGNLFTGSDINGSLTSQPRVFTFSCTSTSDASIARFNPRLVITVANGQTTDAVIGVALLGEETAPFASTPIFPPAGSPAAATRLADSLSGGLASIGVNPALGFTLVGRVVIPQSAPASADQMIWQVDDGTNTNRYAFLNVAGGNSVQTRIGATTGGALFTMTPGTSFSYAASVDVVAGTISVSVNGGTVVTQSGGPTSGLTTLRFGNNATPANNLFGSMQTQRLILSPVATGNLPALSLTV